MCVHRYPSNATAASIQATVQTMYDRNYRGLFITDKTL
jgi:hypothetical protein